MSSHPKFSLEQLQHAIGNTPATTAAWDEVFRELLGALQELDHRIRAVAQESQLAVRDLRDGVEKPKKK